MAEEAAVATEQPPDILAQVREKYPAYANYDDQTLAQALSDKFPVYRPHLRRYLMAGAYGETPDLKAEAAGAVPELEAMQPRDVMHELQKPHAGFQKWAQGIETGGDPRAMVGKGAMEFAASQLSPANALLMGGLAKLPATAAKAAGAAFGFQAGKFAVQAAPEAYRAWKEGRFSDAVSLATQAGLGSLAAFFGAKHGVSELMDFHRGAQAAQTAQSAPAPIPEQQGPLGLGDFEAQKPPAPKPKPAPAGPLDLRAEERVPQGEMPQAAAKPGIESLELPEESPIDRLTLEGIEPEKAAPKLVTALPEHVAQIKQVEAQKGFVESADLPDPIRRQIAAERNIEALAGVLEADRENAQPSLGRRFPIKDSEGYITGYSGSKSPIPKKFQGSSYSHQEIASILRKGLAGEPLSRARQSFFDSMYEHYERRGGPVNEEDIQGYASQHNFDVTTKSLVPEPEPTFDPAELERQSGDISEPQEPYHPIEKEIAAQESILDAQRAAERAIGKALPGSETEDLARQMRQETETTLSQLRPAAPPPDANVVKNEPPAPALNEDLIAELGMRGIDTNDPQSFAGMMAEHAGLKKPVEVTSGDVRVSTSYEHPEAYVAQLAEGKPYEGVHEVSHMAEAEGGPTPPEGPGANDKLVTEFLGKLGGKGGGGLFSRRAISLNEELAALADTVEMTQRQKDILTERLPRIEAKGTIGPEEVKEEFRQEGITTPEQTFDLRISRADISNITARMADAMKQAQKFATDVKLMGDPAGRLAAKAIENNVEAFMSQFKIMRTAWARMGHQFQMPPEMIEYLRTTGRLAKELRDTKIRRPIYTNIAESMANWKNLDPGQKLRAWHDIVDAFRLNLFSVSSFSLDLATNLGELGGQLSRGAAEDLVQLKNGHVLPNLRGFMQALDHRLAWKPVHPEILEAMGHTIGGELIPGFQKGRGTFTMRGMPEEAAGSPMQQAIEKGGGTYRPIPTPPKLVSAAIDYGVAAPLYAKGLMDRAAGNLAAMTTLYAEANLNTPKGLSPIQRAQFRNGFIADPPPASLEVAIRRGNEAKFNRPLSIYEEKLAGSTAYRVLGDMFGRWGFQFARWGGEMIGLDPAAWKRISKGGTVNGVELAGYLGKAATGIGGLYFLNSTIYDHIDFRSMEYVDDDGDRYRLTGREPLPTALTALALFTAVKNQSQGDWEKFRHGLPKSSIPFGKLLDFSGGLLSTIVNVPYLSDMNRKLDPRGISRDLIGWANSAIPGQALLSAVKTIFDPIVREGVGAKLPGISLFLKEAPSQTTGGPLEPEQSIMGSPKFRTIGGVPIPGAKRELDPVYRLLMRYGQPVYRGPRQPIAGQPPSEIPDDLRREWETELGFARQLVLFPLAGRLHLAGSDLDELDKVKDKNGDSVARNLVRKLDAIAGKIATNKINMKYGLQPKPLRQPTMRELTGPSALLDELKTSQAEILKARAEGAQ